jgi:hypothetical protein
MSVKGERSSGEEMVEAPTVIVDTGDVHKDLKIKLPDAYGGERSKLRHFWLHVELFLGFNSKKFMSEQEKVLWVITLFEGPALSWIEGFLQDYLTHMHMEDGERRMRRENEGNLRAPLWVEGGYDTSFREPKALRILFRGDARLVS